MVEYWKEFWLCFMPEPHELAEFVRGMSVLATVIGVILGMIVLIVSSI